MRYVLNGIFLFLTLVFATASYGAELTEESVRQIMSRLDRAVNDRNAKAVANELSNNVSITLNFSMRGQKQVLKPSKQRYISMLEQGWAKYSNYKYSRSNMTIAIKGDKALVSAVVHESMTVQGRNVSGSAKEEVIVELVDGKPVVTGVSGQVSL